MFNVISQLHIGVFLVPIFTQNYTFFVSIQWGNELHILHWPISVLPVPGGPNSKILVAGSLMPLNKSLKQSIMNVRKIIKNVKAF